MNNPRLLCPGWLFLIPGDYLGGGLGYIGLVLVIDHPRGPVLGHEGADVGSWVADAGLGVAQEIILDMELNKILPSFFHCFFWEFTFKIAPEGPWGPSGILTLSREARDDTIPRKKVATTLDSIFMAVSNKYVLNEKIWKIKRIPRYAIKFQGKDKMLKC